MSGPKVVRIVTREEVLAICHGHLARIDAALAQWTRIGSRNDSIDDEAIAAAQARRNALAALIASEQFMDLQKQAPLEEAFLRGDCQRRLAEQVSAKTAEARKARRERDAARAILSALEAKGAAVDIDMTAALERAEPVAIARGLLLLGERRGEGLPADKALGARLKEDMSSSSFEAWLKAQPAVAEHPALTRIQTRIVEILQLEDLDQSEDWRARLDEAASAPSTRRNLIIDALEVETGRALTLARRRADGLSAYMSALGEASAMGLVLPSAKNMEQATVEQIEAETGEIMVSITAQRTEAALKARRCAVLEGLSGLGYEVSEGMSTAWASEGRLVLKSAQRPDYGVELSGIDRVQMRPVAFETGSTTTGNVQSDRDAETIWCSDVGSLQEHLAAAGGGLIIEKALPVGAVPLKRIALEERGDGARFETPSLKSRTLR